MTPTIRKLDRLTACTLFELKTPIWGGGRPSVGLKADRITKHNEITFSYRRKSDGQLTYPDKYYFDGDKRKEHNYPKQVLDANTTVLLIPFNHLERLERV